MKTFVILFFIALAIDTDEGASLQCPPGGGGGDWYPFGIRFTNSSMRYQQVYSISTNAWLAGGGYITEIDFAIASFGHGFNGTLPKIELNLSTTSKLADHLSTNFIENVGTNETTVFGPGPLVIQAPFFGGGGSQPFSVNVNLSTPFFCNPTNGSLLLDVKNYQGYPCLAPEDCAPPFEGTPAANDCGSRVYAQSVNATSATGADTFGLTTQFGVYPVPQLSAEPGTNSVLITWSTHPTVFVLQSATRLRSPNWQTITNGITGDFSFQTLALPRDSLGSQQFFRLVWESGPPPGNWSYETANTIGNAETSPSATFGQVPQYNISHSACGSVRYFNNQTPDGRLIQGCDFAAGQSVNELTTDAELQLLQSS